MNLSEYPAPPYTVDFNEKPPPYSLHNDTSTILSQILETAAIFLPDVFKQSPVADVPPELLQRIFLYACIPSDEDPDLPALRQCQNTVWSCFQVCRTWRSTALDVKELWSLVLDFQRFSVPRLRRLLHLSAPALINIGHRSAPVQIYRTKTDQRGPTSDLHGLLDLIVLNQVRIRELHVEWHLDGSCITDQLYYTLGLLPMPHLEALSWTGGGPFDYCWLDQIDEDSGIITKVASTPLGWKARNTLRRFNVGGACFRLQTPLPTLNHLTEFSCDYPRYYEEPVCPRFGQLWMFLELLRNTPALRFLSIQCALAIGPPLSLSDTDIVHLPDLTLATIGGVDDEELGALFDFVSLIKGSPKCGLQVITPARFEDELLRLKLQIKIADMYELSPTDRMAHIITVEDDGTVTIGNVQDPTTTLDWVHRGGDSVYRELQGLPDPVVSFRLLNSTPHESFLSVLFAFQESIGEQVEHLRLSISPLKPTEEDPRAIADLLLLCLRFIGLETLTLNEMAAMALLRSIRDGFREIQSEISQELLQEFPFVLRLIDTIVLEDCEVSSQMGGLVSLLYEYTGEIRSANRPNKRQLLVFKRPHFVNDGADPFFLEFVFHLTSRRVIVEPFEADYLAYRAFCRRIEY